ncbi:DUF4190 domain-containing protein [Protaetiibacter intestinalis]|uniref:DUF4190 domain-containing protein n=1 Tax=Protaetiibacter intestinalis TaxID=2419774 RepID=A0A387B6Z6_9MICO|nr:DUF4190 domain-containing protein [Protaetiibacter intestinalis]
MATPVAPPPAAAAPAAAPPAPAPAPAYASAPAAPAYQPVPTTPAPYAPAPYTVGGVAYAYAPRTDPLALTSMILSLVGLLFWILGIPGVILGHIALSRIKRTGEGGKGMAIAGIAVGYAVIAFLLIYVAFFVIVFSSTYNSYSDYSGY